ncbi:MAG: beta/gamma crystallin-related protein [Stellaceae bacterium]
MHNFRNLLAAIASAVVLLAAAPQTPVQACEVIVYWDANFRGESLHTEGDMSFVGQHWNDQISSIRVLSGFWEFYWDADYRGEVLRLGPGSYPYVGDHWNDQISSLRCSR